MLVVRLQGQGVTLIVNVSSALWWVSGARQQMVTADPGRSGRVLCTPGVRAAPSCGQCDESIPRTGACTPRRSAATCPWCSPTRLLARSSGPSRQHSAGLSRASHGQLSTGCCSSSQGHSILTRAAPRGRRDAHCCGASLDADFSSARLADLCLCAAAPRAVASVCWPQTGNLLVSPAAGARASLRLSAPTLPLQPREPCTLCCIGLCRTHSAACPLLLAHRDLGQRAGPTLP